MLKVWAPAKGVTKIARTSEADSANVTPSARNHAPEIHRPGSLPDNMVDSLFALVVVHSRNMLRGFLILRAAQRRARDYPNLLSSTSGVMSSGDVKLLVY